MLLFKFFYSNALHYAAMSKSVPTIQFFINHECAVNHKNYWISTNILEFMEFFFLIFDLSNSTSCMRRNMFVRSCSIFSCQWRESKSKR